MVLVKRRNHSPSSEWDQFFEKAFSPSQSILSQSEPTFRPRTDVIKSDTGYLVKIDLPGVEKENIEVSAHEGILSVKATLESNKTEEGENHQWIRRERHTGSYHREFTLDESIDDNSIAAKFENGVLEIRLTEKETEELKPKSIAIE